MSPAPTPAPRALPLALIGLAVTLLAACSSADPGPSRPSTPAASTASSAVSASASAPATAGPSAGATPSGPAPAAKLTGKALGARVEQAAKAAGSVSAAVLVTGPLAITGQDAARIGPNGTTQLRTAAGFADGSRVEVIRDGRTVYLKLPAEPMPGKPWLLVDLAAEDPMTSTYTAAFKGYETPVDLSATVSALAAAGPYRAVGAEAVDKVAATKYEATTSALVASAVLPPAFQPVNPTRLKAGRATVAVWLDGSGRLLRTAVTARTTGSAPIKVLISYSGWGAAVSVQAPPRDQVGSAAAG